tara:strand:+ start:616 stop:888 length:273 start_codon:yes stop_codon:yes gene_type:complete
MIAIANYVWVKPDEVEQKTDSGIITSIDKITPNTGTVIAIGKACDRDIIGDLKEGDRVFFNKDTITRDKHPDTGEDVFRFPDRNILAIIE